MLSTSTRIRRIETWFDNKTQMTAMTYTLTVETLEGKEKFE